MIRPIFAIAIVFLLTGCVSRTPQLQMLVSGPPGIGYTANYQVGDLSGAVKSATSGLGFDVFLDIPASDGHCEVIKDRPTDALSVVAAERHPTQRVNGFVPSGTRGIRFIRETGAWRFELLQ